MGIFAKKLCAVLLISLLSGCSGSKDFITSETPSLVKIPDPTFTPFNTPIAYDELTTIEISSRANLIASPAFPDSRIVNVVVEPGAQVYLVGSDKDNAWLLVLYKNTLGWIPSILSTVGTGVIDPSTVAVPQLDDCSIFLGSIITPDGDWESIINTKVLVQGFIYNRVKQENSELITLVFQIEETGQEYLAEIDQIELESGNQILLYTAFIDDIHTGHHIKYKLNGLDAVITPFQAAFFTGDCSGQIGAVQPIQTTQPIFTPKPPMPTLVIRITSSVMPPAFSPNCSDEISTKIRINDLVRVTSNGQGLRLRSFPEVNDNNIKARLSAGTQIKIFDGPACSDGFIFWWVKVKSTGAFGWVAEGDSSGPFIEMINRP